METTQVIEAARTALEREVDRASTAMRQFPRENDGLTPDSVKQSPEWREANRAYLSAFAALRAFNTKHKPRRKPRVFA